MAEIIPFKAWRYNKDLSKSINELTSPLFDVVSEKHRKNLYKNEFNSVHISVPQGDQPAKQAQNKIEEWKKQGIIEQDQIPGIYVYYQHFELPGDEKHYCRKGFICNFRIYDWDSDDPKERMILRHENTMPNAVYDRKEIVRATKLNVSPTHGLYSDPNFELEQYMDESMLAPIYDTEDYQGVRDVLSVIHDAEIIKKFQKIIKNQQVILADGHHRYEGSLAYCQEMQALNQEHTGNEAYNFHLMFLTNLEAKDLRILPTHRLVKKLNMSLDLFLEKAEEYFTIREIENFYDINEIIIGKKWAFGLLLKDRAFKIRLKPEKISELKWPFPDQVKELDLTVLHYFILEKILGILGKDQRSSDIISFDRSFSDCLSKVLRDEEELAIITNEITMKEVTEVCHSGFTLPQKSTYFYPKVICGFLFSSIMQNEFEMPSYFRL